MLTPKEEITKRLINGYDKWYYESLYRQQVKAFGDAISEVSSDLGASGRFPDFPVVTLRIQEVGTSHRILSTQFITLSRIMRADPEPESPEVDKWTGEVRKQFFLARARGTGNADGEWMDQHTNVFLDGDGLGCGVALIGLKVNPNTKKNYVDIRHVPITQVLWDRNERSLSRARWVCVMHYLALDLAEALYGAEIVKQYSRDLWQNQSEEPVHVVRIFEYYDLGFGKGEPTRAIIPGDLDQTPIEVTKNVFQCLPIAFYEHLLRPGMRRPTGRIAMLLAGQESLNECERSMRAEMRRVGFDMLAADLINVTDIGRINDGESGVVARMDRMLNPGEVPFIRIPGAELTQTTLAYKEDQEKEFVANSGVTELDRGSFSNSERTLGENQLVDQRSKTQSNWSVLQLARYYRRLCEKVFKIAAIGDTDPVTLDIFGTNVTLNSGDPNSAVETWMEEPSKIVISEDSLLKGDLTSERMAAVQQLQPLLPFVGQGVDPGWFIPEMIEALGFDPKEAMGQAGQMALQQAQQPQPGQPQPGQPLAGAA